MPRLWMPNIRAMLLLAAYGSLRFRELAGLRRHRDVSKTIRVEESAVELANGRVIFGLQVSGGRRTIAILLTSWPSLRVI